jgi:hypothetical protein
MANIIIHNHGTININEINNTFTVNQAKDELLAKMYYARNNQTLGGRKGWEKLLGLYYCGQYKEMLNYLNACEGKGGKTRNRCKELIKRIMKGE